MSTRRDFIKWVLYLGAVQALPAISSVAEIPHNILEGLSATPKALAVATGYPHTTRLNYDTAFEACMKRVWREANGDARYVRISQDLGIQEAHHWTDHETGEVYEEPESYVTFFQYRRA